MVIIMIRFSLFLFDIINPPVLVRGRDCGSEATPFKKGRRELWCLKAGFNEDTWKSRKSVSA